MGFRNQVLTRWPVTAINLLMSMVTIYGLFDPRRPALIMYVGQSINPYRRLHQHRTRKTGNVRLTRWITHLQLENYQIEMWPLEVVSRSEMEQAERHWIAHWREQNPALLNMSDGGEHSPTDLNEVRSRAMLEVWRRPNFKETRLKRYHTSGIHMRIGPLTKWGEFYDRRRYYKGWRRRSRDPILYVCNNPACGITYQRQVGRRNDCGTKFCCRKCSDSVSSVKRGASISRVTGQRSGLVSGTNRPDVK